MNKQLILSLAVLGLLVIPAASHSLILAQQPPASSEGPGPNPGPPPFPEGQVFGEHPGMGEGGGMGGFHMGPPGLWWKNPQLVQQIGLTPDQQKRMEDILQQNRLQLIDLKANVERQEVLLHPLLDQNPPDTNKVLAQVDKVAQARAELEKSNARMLLGIRTVLTPDQWTKLQTLHRSRWESRRGPMAMEDHDGQGPGSGGPWRNGLRHPQTPPAPSAPLSPPPAS